MTTTHIVCNFVIDSNLIGVEEASGTTICNYIYGFAFCPPTTASFEPRGDNTAPNVSCVFIHVLNSPMIVGNVGTVFAKSITAMCISQFPKGSVHGKHLPLHKSRWDFMKFHHHIHIVDDFCPSLLKLLFLFGLISAGFPKPNEVMSACPSTGCIAFQKYNKHQEEKHCHF
eukprot:UN23401